MPINELKKKKHKTKKKKKKKKRKEKTSGRFLNRVKILLNIK
jgi:hypothetical protein